MLLLAGSLVCAIFAAIIASNKGRSAVGWFFLGLIFSLIAVLAVGFLPRIERKFENRETGIVADDNVQTEPSAPADEKKSQAAVATTNESKRIFKKSFIVTSIISIFICYFFRIYLFKLYIFLFGPLLNRPLFNLIWHIDFPNF